MSAYDWIVIGGGITGAALAYELQNVGFVVLVLERDRYLQGASRLSYGGIPFWSGTDETTRQLCQEGSVKHQNLSSELGFDTEFRKLDLLLTISPHDDRDVQAKSFGRLEFPPTLLSPSESLELEPLLNIQAIAGSWLFPHAHVNPLALCEAYKQAFLRLGGIWLNEKVLEVTGQTVRTSQAEYICGKTAVCAGGIARSLLGQSGIQAKLYFTHCEVLETEATDLELRTMVMPASNGRLDLESRISQPDLESFWQNQQALPDRDFSSLAIDVGAIQFGDRTIKIGQPSYVHPDPEFKSNPIQNEKMLRDRMAKILPKLAELPGTYNHCLVAFSVDSLPLIGELPLSNIYLFTSFTSPTIYVPPLAQHFAQSFAAENKNELLTKFSPSRFA
jgi:glycine/D-amino acid oxidase-like deaminating enzyme